MPATEARLTPSMVQRGIPAAPGKNYGEVADLLCPGRRIRTTWPKQGARLTRFFRRYRHRVTGKLKSAWQIPRTSLREARRIVEDDLRPRSMLASIYGRQIGQCVPLRMRRSLTNWRPNSAG